MSMQKARQGTDAIAAVRQEGDALARRHALRRQHCMQATSRLWVNGSNECKHFRVAVLRDALSGNDFEAPVGPWCLLVATADVSAVEPDRDGRSRVRRVLNLTLAEVVKM